jgi:hypothetical protein
MHLDLPSKLVNLSGTLYYAYGLMDTKAPTNWVDSYDTTKAIWEVSPPRIIASAVRASFTFDGKWFVLGAGGTLEAFDPIAKKWTLKAPVPKTIPDYVPTQWPWPEPERLYMVVKGGKALLMYRERSFVEVWSYEIGADQWTRLPGFPSQGGNWSVLQTESGKVYTLNGRQLLEYLGN